MRHSGLNRFCALTGACVALSLIATTGWSQTLTWLGTLGGNYSLGLGVSADGSVVVGYARTDTFTDRAFRWTANDGMQALVPGFDWSYAMGISADGSTVVGYAGTRAFRWTADGGMQSLGTLQGGFSSRAFAASANGSVVVGWSYNADRQLRAFRWTADGRMQELGTLGGTLSEAYGVSADGNIVVGGAYNSDERNRAFRWKADEGMQNLGVLPGGNWSAANAVSADGSIVVGSSDAGGVYRAFRWTEAGGMEDLNVAYANLLDDGSYLETAQAISPDGRYIVDTGYNAATGRREAYLLDTRPSRRAAM